MSGPPVRDCAFAELTAREVHDLLRLRVDVFVVEQSCPYAEVDGRDTEPTTRHIWTTDADGRPTAYLRLLDDGRARRIGHVVVRSDVRSQGLARALVTHALGAHRGPWVLDAQSRLRDWYERLGFVVSGSEFVDDGIPHLPMRLEMSG